MKKMNYYGTVLTDKYYIFPGPNDHLSLPVIKTPVVISDKFEIVDWTFATQRDEYIESCGCVKCGSDTLSPTLGNPPTVTRWRCVICGHTWKTYRGIFIKPMPMQMALFEVVG